jgi:hypothetical protein
MRWSPLGERVRIGRALRQLPRIEALSVSEWLTAATRAWATRWVS